MKGKLVSVPLAPKLARRLNDDLTPILEVPDLPVNWQDISADPVGQKIGLKWLKAMEYPVLKVASAIIPVEYNYIINPEHPDLRLQREQVLTALHYLVCSIDSMLSKESKQINMISEKILAVIDDRVQFRYK